MRPPVDPTVSYTVARSRTAGIVEDALRYLMQLMA